MHAYHKLIATYDLLTFAASSRFFLALSSSKLGTEGG
jgi:hypothetical protein